MNNEGKYNDFSKARETLKVISDINWDGIDIVINKICEISQFINNINVERISNSIQAIDKTMSPVIEEIQKYDFTPLIGLVAEYGKYFVDADFVDKVNEVDIQQIINNKPGATITEVANEVYRIANNGECEDVVDDELIKEVVNEIASCKDNSKGFQEKACDFFEEIRKKYFVIIIVIWFFYSIFVEPYLQENMGVPIMTRISSKVRSEPNTGSEVVCIMGESTEAIAEEDLNYYYKVYYVNENGEEYVGYIAKKNVAIMNDEDK